MVRYVYVQLFLKERFDKLLSLHRFMGYIRGSSPEVFYKNVFLEISQNSQENTCARVSFLIKLQASRTQACNFIKKETLAQVLSCEFVNFLRIPFFIENLWWLLLEYFTQNNSLRKSERFSITFHKVLIFSEPLWKNLEPRHEKEKLTRNKYISVNILTFFTEHLWENTSASLQLY